MDSIIVNADLDGKKINRDIYGHFSEHLGRCIYGGFWVGKDSKIPRTLQKLLRNWKSLTFAGRAAVLQMNITGAMELVLMKPASA